MTYPLRIISLLRLLLRQTILLPAFLLLYLPTVHAQISVRGTVHDASTGEVLPSASIQIEGTLRGTITNRDGHFELAMERLPAVMLVYYIGYETARISVNESMATGPVDIRLRPVALQMPEVTVSAVDPGNDIMRRVIERKQEWWSRLESYEAEAYGRFTVSNDTGIVFITETVTDAHWSRGRMSETVRARRQTSNLPSALAVPVAATVTNLYADDIEVGGNRLVGVTHPGALRVYDFRVIGRRLRDDRIVYDISVTPRSQLATAFAGRVSVIEEEWALIDVELRPHEAFLYPPPIRSFDVAFRQQFSNYGGDFWLPVDFRFEARLDIGIPGLSFPDIHVEQIVRINRYQVNIPVPDSLFDVQRRRTGVTVRVDTASVAEGTRLARAGATVPLTDREQAAYETIDSTMTLEQAFRPSGMLARMASIRVTSGEASASAGRRSRRHYEIRPSLGFNRVDGARLGLQTSLRPTGSTRVDGSAVLARARAEADWSAGAQWRSETDAQKPFVLIRTDLYSESTPITSRPFYPPLLQAGNSLLGGADYSDYFHRQGGALRVGYRMPQTGLTLDVSGTIERHSSLPQRTRYALFGRRADQPNPAVDEGELRSIGAKLSLSRDAGVPLAGGRRNVTVGVEWTGEGLLGGDFTFARADLELVWRVNTFLRRRFLPNALDVRLSGATSTGTLPLQRFSTLDGSLGPLTPFGAFRTRQEAPYYGEHHLAAFWEHNFRTVPFELLGMRRVTRSGLSLIVHGAHGQTWIAAERHINDVPGFIGSTHHELGASLSGIFGVIRVDVTRRLDRPGTSLGIGLARIF
jgi:hypothetical protein